MVPDAAGAADGAGGASAFGLGRGLRRKQAVRWARSKHGRQGVEDGLGHFFGDLPDPLKVVSFTCAGLVKS